MIFRSATLRVDGEVRGNMGSSHTFAGFGNKLELYGQVRAFGLVEERFHVILLILVQYTVSSAYYIK